MTRLRGLAALITLGTALVAAPAAHAEDVVCEFSVAKPFVYSVNGTDYMGSRVDVSGCRTELAATPLTIWLHLTASGAPLELAGPSHTFSYHQTRDVHDGDSFSVVFPNDDRLMPLYPGVYGAKASVHGGAEQLSETPHFADYQCSTWEFPGMTCTPATHI